MLDAATPIRQCRGRPRRRPGKLHADKACDVPRCRQACHARHIVPRIARRGPDTSQRLGRHRQVVEGGGGGGRGGREERGEGEGRGGEGEGGGKERGGEGGGGGGRGGKGGGGGGKGGGGGGEEGGGGGGGESEQTFAWFAHFRRLVVRSEQRADIFEAFHHLAAAIICCRFVEQWFC